MEPAPGSLPVIEGQVALRDIRPQTVLGKFALAEGSGEEATRVATRFEVDQKRAFQSGFGEDHLSTPSLSLPTRGRESADRAPARGREEVWRQRRVSSSSPALSSDFSCRRRV